MELRSMLSALLNRQWRRVRRLSWRGRCALALVGLPLHVTSSAVATAQSSDTLVVGTYAYATNDRVAAVSPLASHLARRLARPTRVTSFPDPVALSRAVRAGRVDVAVTNTFGYLLVGGSDDAAAVAVATFGVPAGVRTHYGSVVVTRDTSVRTTADVVSRARELRIALVSPGSTTGNLVPRLYLASAGLADLEGAMLAVTYAGTHAGAVDSLRARRVELAALATEEYDKQVAADRSGASRQWRELWRSPDILLGPVAVRRALPLALRDSIAAAVVGLERETPAAFAALKGGWVEARLADAMLAASDATYDPVRRMFGDARTTAALIARFAR
jgi:phosphonate transport system substrate-binding protein